MSCASLAMQWSHWLGSHKAGPAHFVVLGMSQYAPILGVNLLVQPDVPEMHPESPLSMPCHQFLKHAHVTHAECSR